MSQPTDPREEGIPYRASGRAGPEVYHTVPRCPSGRQVKYPKRYTGNEHGLVECEQCQRIKAGELDPGQNYE